MHRDQGERAEQECVCPRTDLNTTSRFSEVVAGCHTSCIGHNTVQTTRASLNVTRDSPAPHGSDLRIPGVTRTSIAATRPSPATSSLNATRDAQLQRSSNLNFNGRYSAQSSEFLTGCHTRRTAATQLEPYIFPQDATRNPTAAFRPVLVISSPGAIRDSEVSAWPSLNCD